MKLPKVFVPEKKLEKKVEMLSKEPEQLKNNMLLESCKEYLIQEKKCNDFMESYELAEKITKKINPDQKDLEHLSELIKNEKKWLSIYFSALVNKIIDEDDIMTFNFYEQLCCLGSYLEKGTLVIEGNTGTRTGFKMKGGNIQVQGNATHWTGLYMEGGIIHIQGNAGESTGWGMKDGEIHVDGKINHIDIFCRGKIYNKGELVWPKKKKKWIFF